MWKNYVLILIKLLIPLTCLKQYFSYSSRPRPLQARRKYRNEPGQAEGYRNLMFDRRIVRGNTYAREDVLPVTAQV